MGISNRHLSADLGLGQRVRTSRDDEKLPVVSGLADEDCMEARKLLRDVVNVLAQAFDEAWASMAHTVEPARAKKVKSSLARVIVAQPRGARPRITGC